MTMSATRALEALHRVLHRHWAEAATHLGVTYSEFEYLRAIQAQEDAELAGGAHGQHLQDVVQTMGVKKASASAMVVKLEQRGLVTRVPCRYDARAQHILISESGLALLRTGEAIYARAAEALGSQLGEAAWFAVHRALKPPTEAR